MTQEGGVRTQKRRMATAATSEAKRARTTGTDVAAPVAGTDAATHVAEPVAGPRVGKSLDARWCESWVGAVSECLLDHELAAWMTTSRNANARLRAQHDVWWERLRRQYERWLDHYAALPAAELARRRIDEADVALLREGWALVRADWPAKGAPPNDPWYDQYRRFVASTVGVETWFAVIDCDTQRVHCWLPNHYGPESLQGTTAASLVRAHERCAAAASFAAHWRGRAAAPDSDEDDEEEEEEEEEEGENGDNGWAAWVYAPARRGPFAASTYSEWDKQTMRSLPALAHGCATAFCVHAVAVYGGQFAGAGARAVKQHIRSLPVHTGFPGTPMEAAPPGTPLVISSSPWPTDNDADTRRRRNPYVTPRELVSGDPLRRRAHLHSRLANARALQLPIYAYDGGTDGAADGAADGQAGLREAAAAMNADAATGPRMAAPVADGDDPAALAALYMEPLQHALCSRRVAQFDACEFRTMGRSGADLLCRHVAWSQLRADGSPAAHSYAIAQDDLVYVCGVPSWPALIEQRLDVPGSVRAAERDAAALEAAVLAPPPLEYAVEKLWHEASECIRAAYSLGALETAPHHSVCTLGKTAPLVVQHPVAHCPRSVWSPRLLESRCPACGWRRAELAACDWRGPSPLCCADAGGFDAATVAAATAAKLCDSCRRRRDAPSTVAAWGPREQYVGSGAGDQTVAVGRVRTAAQWWSLEFMPFERTVLSRISHIGSSPALVAATAAAVAAAAAATATPSASPLSHTSDMIAAS